MYHNDPQNRHWFKPQRRWWQRRNDKSLPPLLKRLPKDLKFQFSYEKLLVARLFLKIAKMHYLMPKRSWTAEIPRSSWHAHEYCSMDRFELEFAGPIVNSILCRIFAKTATLFHFLSCAWLLVEILGILSLCPSSLYEIVPTPKVWWDRRKMISPLILWDIAQGCSLIVLFGGLSCGERGLYALICVLT